MPQTIATLAEALIAVLALVGLLAGVRPGVLGEGGQVAVAVVADLAVVGFLARMDSSMGDERRLLYKGFATFVACVTSRLFDVMASLVRLEPIHCPEFSRAIMALVSLGQV